MYHEKKQHMPTTVMNSDKMSMLRSLQNLCGQQRPRTACASEHSDQSLDSEEYIDTYQVHWLIWSTVPIYHEDAFFLGMVHADLGF